MTGHDDRTVFHAAAFPGAIILPVGGIMPTIDPSAYVAPGVILVGDVRIGPLASIWYGTVIRADNDAIIIGERTNVQDGTIMHSDKGQPIVIGRDVTIGHGARIHSSRLADLCLVGIGAVLLNEASVATGSIVAAGALLPPRKQVPPGQLWAGNPARHLRDVTEAERAYLVRDAEHYIEQARRHSGVST